MKADPTDIKPADTDSKKLLEEVMRMHHSAKQERMGWDTHWQNLTTYCQPRKAYVTQGRTITSPIGEKESQLFDSSAVQANMTLAAGHMSWMTPADSRWFDFSAPAQFNRDDEVKAWFFQCSMIAARTIARSNFYTEVHETYLDRGCFGTAALFIGESKKGGLTFRNEEIASYTVAENSEGTIDTFIREVELDYRQAYQEYGDQCAPDLLKEWKKDPAACHTKKAKFIQAVYPRLDRDANNPHFMHKEFASVHIDITNKHICRQGGYDELPWGVSRYLKWGTAVYGWSPSWVALPEMRQLNFIAKNIDLLTELRLFPRLLLPAGMRNQVDLRPGGVTYMKEGLTKDDQPREWATVGDIREGMEREGHKRDAINKAFHVDLFQMFAQMERNAQMTAREVAERASEKLVQFSPTFARLTGELYIPMLRRTFRILFNGGYFPPPPRQIMQNIGNQWLLPEPQIEFSSRVALAMRQQENVSFMRTMDGLAPIAKIKPDILDQYDWNAISRDMARNEGLPEQWILPQEVVAQITAATQQRNAQMEQAQIAAHVAGAAGKLGSIKPGSPAAKMMEQAQTQTAQS